jgi:hypothetical protein
MDRIWQDKGFRYHLIIYAVVNALLIIINLSTSPDKLWFYWPLLGWGIGLAAHGFGVYRRGDRLRRPVRAGTPPRV